MHNLSKQTRKATNQSWQTIEFLHFNDLPFTATFHNDSYVKRKDYLVMANDNNLCFDNISTYIQLRAKLYIRLLNTPYVNGVTLREQNSSLKCCSHLNF